MALFSLLIPIYQVADVLDDCLRSIQEQSFSDYEAILVDDGSTDGSAALADRIAAADSRFRALHQENRGVGAARNRALADARGDYVWFVDGDDCLLPGSLETLAEQIHSHPDYDLIGFGHVRGTARDWPTWAAVEPLRPVHVIAYECDRPVDFVSVYQRNWDGVWSYCFRRVFAQSLTFGRYLVCEDTVYLLQALYAARRVLALDAQLLFYRQRNGSATHVGTLPHFSGMLEAMVAAARLESPRRAWIERTLCHRLASNVLFGQAFLVYARLPQAVRRTARDCWFDKLDDFYHAFPNYRPMRYAICRAAHSMTLARALFGLPYWMKRLLLSFGWARKAWIQFSLIRGRHTAKI